MSSKLEDRSLYYDSESLEIAIDKTKVIIAILASILFLVLGFWFVIFFATMQTRYSPLLIQILGITSILFFGIALFFTVPKYFDKNPVIFPDCPRATWYAGYAFIPLPFQNLLYVHRILDKSN